MNRENMTKLALFLEDLPSERFNIEHWVSGVCYYENTVVYHSDDNHKLSINDCGTAGCVAGWALCLKNQGNVEIIDDDWYFENDEGPEDYQVNVVDIRYEAAKWLGIPVSECDRLFQPDRYSLWYQYKEDYGLESISENNIWISDIHPNDAADMLYRLLIGDVEL